MLFTSSYSIAYSGKQTPGALLLKVTYIKKPECI